MDKIDLSYIENNLILKKFVILAKCDCLSESRKLSGLQRHSTTVSGEVLTKREESKTLQILREKSKGISQKDRVFFSSSFCLPRRSTKR